MLLDQIEESCFCGSGSKSDPDTFPEGPTRDLFLAYQTCRASKYPKNTYLKKNIKLKLKFAMCMALLPYKITPPPNPKTHKI